MPMVRGDIAALLAPGLNMRTFGRYRDRAEEYRRICNVKDSRKAYEEDFEISGLGPLAPKAELETTILDEPIQLGLVRYIHTTMSLGIQISKEARDDDQYAFFMNLAGELGRSARYTADLFGHDVYNFGFVTTKYTGRDGLALFNTAHPIQGTGGTYGNRPSPDVDLGQAALEAAIQSFEDQIDERGIPIDNRPKYLVTSPLNRMNAKRLLNSTHYPNQNINDINPVYDEGLQLLTQHYLTDKDAWFLLSDQNELDVKFYWREMPDTKTWDDNDGDSTFHKIRMRLSVGFGNWRNSYGTVGA